MKIKIKKKIKGKFFLLNDEIKMRNQFNKMIKKKFIWMRTKLNKIIHNKLGLNDEMKTYETFTKWLRKKIN